MPGSLIFDLARMCLQLAVALTKLTAVIVPENMNLELYFRCMQTGVLMHDALISPWNTIHVFNRDI